MNLTKRQDLLDCLFECGDRMYTGEPVTQLEHAWQCAQLARKSGASKALQLASWLHDIGHLLVGWHGTPTLRGENDQHEVVAAHVLGELWGEAVAEPVRLHVQAKRYLVSRRSSYLRMLSADSVRSLQLQGGVMSEEEMHVFEASPFHGDALKLRIWDDLGKKPSWFGENRFQVLEQLSDLMQDVSASVIENSSKRRSPVISRVHSAISSIHRR